MHFSCRKGKVTVTYMYNVIYIRINFTNDCLVEVVGKGWVERSERICLADLGNYFQWKDTEERKRNH